MAYGVRTKKYEQFNEGKCVSVQPLRITWVYKNQYIETNLPLRKIKGPHGEFQYYPTLWIANKQLNEDQIKILATNDGFASVEDFFKWFHNDFSGKIIHWTKLLY
jgi:hypothetical protein